MTRSSWPDTEPLDALPPLTTAGGEAVDVARFTCRVVAGPDTGLVREADGLELAIGAAAGNELELRDRAVSNYHCAIRASARGYQLVDLGSTNGVWIGAVRIESAYLETGAVLRVGSTRVRLEVLDGRRREPLAAERRFGALVGASAPMRRLFEHLRRLAATSAPILVFGGPGTGKTSAALAIHRHSARRDRLLVVVRCDGVPPETLDDARVAAARGGTLLVEEIGELDPAGQARLRELLEAPDGPRVVATSSRDVRADVNAGRLDPVLYRRFHHARARMPPLAERRDDVRLLATAFYRELGGPDAGEPPAELLARLARQEFGTLRDLRAMVARALLAR